MNDLETLSAEANDSCSLVYLIDEDLCLGNSYDVMNTNFESVSASQDGLTKYADVWYGLYTEFSANSSKWLSALYNITTLSSKWESAYTTKEDFKQYWDVPIYLVYPEILNFDTYYTNISTSIAAIGNWLTINFPPKQYALNQKIDISINLYTIDSFLYNFYRTLTECCTPASGNSSVSLCCGGCGRGSVGLCNHYTYTNHGHDRQASCHQICDDCGISVDYHCESYSCQTYSAPQGLVLSYNTSFSDRYINRIVSLIFQNTGTVWTNI